MPIAATTVHPAHADPVPPRPTFREEPVLGVPLALTDYESTLDWIDATIARGERGYVCVAAVHTVMACQEDPELRKAVAGADFTVPDGQPLVWAMNALGHDLPSRVYGPELMERACERAARTGVAMYLYGGRDEVAQARLADNLRRRHPGLRIVGGYVPPFRQLTAEEERRVVGGGNAPRAGGGGGGIGGPQQGEGVGGMRGGVRAPGAGGGGGGVG